MSLLSQMKSNQAKAEFSKVLPKYVFKKLLGIGSFGKVVSCFDNLNNIEVAIKRIGLAHLASKAQEHIINEVQILDFLDNENTLTLLDVLYFIDNSKDGDMLFIVTEKMDTDLARILKNPKYLLSNDLIKHIAFQIFRGIHYLHSSNIFHRDLHPSNILLDSELNVKIGDFGLARSIDDKVYKIIDYTVNNVNPNYRSPEILENKSTYTKAIDLWSAGCILAEMAFRREIFPGKNPYGLLQKIRYFCANPESLNEPNNESQTTTPNIENNQFIHKSNLSNLFPNTDQFLLDLICRLLEYEPEKRLTADQCLNHPYFSKYFNNPAFQLPKVSPRYEFSWSNIKINDLIFKLLLTEILKKYHTVEEALYRAPTQNIENKEEEKGMDI